MSTPVEIRGRPFNRRELNREVRRNHRRIRIEYAGCGLWWGQRDKHRVAGISGPMIRMKAATIGTWLSKCSPAFRLMMATSWLAPESCRPLQDGSIRAACAEGLDWDEYLRLVERHRTPALSWAALKRVPGIAIPEETSQNLKRRSDACRLRAAVHLQLLRGLLKALNTAEIPALPWKGPLLSLELYGDAGMRESKDLDLLVAVADIATASRCLKQIGWHPRRDDSYLTPKMSEFLTRHEHHVEFFHVTHHCVVELHWRTLWESSDSHSRRSAASIWSRWQGCSLQTMNAVDLTIDLCEHGCGHAWFRAKWLGDIARIVAAGHVVVEEVLERARESGQERSFLQCLRLLQDAYGLPVPDSVEPEVLRLDPFVVQRTIQKLTDPSEPRLEFSVKGFCDRLLNASYVRRLWPRKSRWAIFVEVAFCSADFELIRLPDRLFWLYIPLRPFLWVWRCTMSKAR